MAPVWRTGRASNAIDRHPGTSGRREGQGPAAEARVLIVVLDTGGASALSAGDHRSRQRLHAVHRLAADLLLPTAVLAEGLFTGHGGRDFAMHRLLALTRTVEVSARLGLVAGILRTEVIRGGVRRPPSGVDAIVAAVANDAAAADRVEILTSDPKDLKALSSYAPNGARISVVTVD